MGRVLSKRTTVMGKFPIQLESNALRAADTALRVANTSRVYSPCLALYVFIVYINKSLPHMCVALDCFMGQTLELLIIFTST